MGWGEYVWDTVEKRIYNIGDRGLERRSLGEFGLEVVILGRYCFLEEIEGYTFEDDYFFWS